MVVAAIPVSPSPPSPPTSLAARGCCPSLGNTACSPWTPGLLAVRALLLLRSPHNRSCRSMAPVLEHGSHLCNLPGRECRQGAQTAQWLALAPSPHVGQTKGISRLGSGPQGCARQHSTGIYSSPSCFRCQEWGWSSTTSVSTVHGDTGAGVVTRGRPACMGTHTRCDRRRDTRGVTHPCSVTHPRCHTRHGTHAVSHTWCSHTV